eukprot:2464579-Amphidinium_carterae.1
MELLEAVVLCDSSLTLFASLRGGGGDACASRLEDTVSVSRRCGEAADSWSSRPDSFGFHNPAPCSSADGFCIRLFGFKAPVGHFLRFRAVGFARRANIDAGHFLLGGIGG